MLVRVFIDESRAANRELLDLGGQGHGANYTRAAAFRRLNNPLGRLVEHAVVIRLQTNPNPLFSHFYPPNPKSW
jgi:hypothetical protein